MRGPKYEWIKRDIMDAIVQGRLKVGDRVATEAQLSERYGVSRITAQRAMTELKHSGIVERHPRLGTFIVESEFIPVQPTDPVLNAGRKLGDIHVGVVAPFHVATTGMYLYLDSIISAADNRSGRLHLYSTCYDAQMEREVLEQCMRSDIRGVIYYPCLGEETPVDQLIRMRAARFPIVLIDKRLDGLDIASVQTDNTAAMRELTERVLAAGHRHLVYVADANFATTPTVRDRYIGFCNATTKAGISHEYARFSPRVTPSNAKMAAKRAHEIMQALPRWRELGITAVLCDVDGNALEIQDACAISPDGPFHFSVVGVDGLHAHRLTSMRQPYEEIGSKAAQLLYRQIVEGDFTSYDVRLPATFVDGGTLRPPQSQSTP